MKAYVSTLKVAFLSVVLTVALAAVSFAADSAQATLTVADCVKCHTAPPAAIAANGGKHKTEISCQDCHASHRPSSKNNIPQCSQCHSGKPHYSLTNCLRCHTNPHTPKQIKLANNITDECLTCHTQQIVKLKQVKSKHSALACSFCHNVHGKIPQCTQCHKPHSPQMVATDCKRCHQAHMPTAVTYPSDTPNSMCGSCHKKAFELHSNTDTKHKGVNCVTCHKDKHKTVPACQSCHGLPHPPRMLARFTKCGDCHNIAHDLNRWDAGTLKKSGAENPDSPIKLPAKKKRK